MAPNLTNQKLRRTGGDCYMRQYQIDPYWGIPAGQPPLALDTTTGLVRPFSSFNTLATAVDNFVGFAWDYFVPGEKHSVWVITQGWFEMKLATPQEVIAGDKFKSVLITATPNYVSDDTVEPASGPSDTLAIFTAVKSCICNPFFDPVSCPGDVPVASDLSPTAAISRQTQKTVLLSFGV